MLRIENLVACYGALEVVHGVSLNVEQGEMVAVIGANGAGKSTLLKSISHLLPPTSGSVSFMGQDITRLAPHKIAKLGICLVPEGRQLFSSLTVIDNLELGAYVHYWGRRHKKEATECSVERVFEIFPILKERFKQLAGTLSGGEQQMLAIGRALMAKPKLMLLDEPSLGMSPMIQATLMDVISRLCQEGISMLLVEQNVELGLSMSDRAYVMETGRIVLEGTGKELLGNEQVKHSYLAGIGREA